MGRVSTKTLEPAVPGLLQHPQGALGGDVNRVDGRPGGLGHGDRALGGDDFADHGPAVREVLERGASGGGELGHRAGEDGPVLAVHHAQHAGAPGRVHGRHVVGHRRRRTGSAP